MLKLTDKGFTLMEIILVIFLLGFLVVNLNISSVDKINKKLEVDRLINDLETYRDEALISKRNIEFRIKEDRKTYEFSERASKRKKLLERKIESGYKLYLNLDKFYIVFRPTGAPDKGVKLTLRDGFEELNIFIQPVTGNIRLE